MKPVKVLIVEDESLIAWGLKTTLEDMGYEVPAVLDCGKVAAAEFDTYRPDIIFMDINLANNTNGIEAAQKINAVRSVPIVFITQSQEEQVWNEAIFKGHAAYYLFKPFSKSQVSLALAMGLKKAESLHVDTVGNVRDQPLTEEPKLKTTVSLPNEPKPEAAENYTLNDSIFIKEKYAFVKVAVGDILYLQAQGSYCFIHTRKKDFTLSSNLNHFEKKLSFLSHLQRCNRSFIVNIIHVTQIKETDAWIGDLCIPIGEKYEKEFKSKFRFLR